MVNQEREHTAYPIAQETAAEEGRVGLTDDTSDSLHDDFDMASFIDETLPSYEVGQIISGKVLKVTTDDVVVDIGSKSEGVIPLREFLEDGKDPNVFVGMSVDVMVESREGSDGLPRLSRQKAKERLAKKNIRKAFEKGLPVKCVVKSILKGGFQVDVDGLRGFIPFSQMGPGARTPEDQQALIGQSIEAKILEMRNKRDLILSQRKAIEEKRERLRQETLSSLKEGNWVKGIIKNLTEFGAFVDLGGIDGLLHINDMSWGHVGHPREVVNVGNEVEVMILSMDGERISLGMKQKFSDPWLTVQDKYPPGCVVGGKVTSITKYGSFVELEPGVEGLIHISEMSWTKRVHHPSEVLKDGEEVRVKVLGIDEERKRISLSLRQTTVDPWTLARNNYPPGTVIEGEVTGMTDFGAFVRLPEGVDGMIHISDMAWGEKITHPKKLLKKGERVRVKVLEIDPDQQRISLGLKQMDPDPWDLAHAKYRVGEVVQVKVTRMTEFGAFVELEPGIEGLAHSSTLIMEKGQRLEDAVRVGDVVSMKILKFDRGNRKISLSLKDYVKEQEQQEVQKYMSDVSGGNATLGELLGEKMRVLMKQSQKASQPKEPPKPAVEPKPAAPVVESVPQDVQVVEPEPAAVAEPTPTVQSPEPETVLPAVETLPEASEITSAAPEPEVVVAPEPTPAVEPVVEAVVEAPSISESAVCEAVVEAIPVVETTPLECAAVEPPAPVEEKTEAAECNVAPLETIACETPVVEVVEPSVPHVETVQTTETITAQNSDNQENSLPETAPAFVSPTEAPISGESDPAI